MDEVKPMFVENLLILYAQDKLPSVKKVLQECFNSNDTGILENILQSYTLFDLLALQQKAMKSLD
ncbi:hypothetical protein [Bacillus altitudinis]|uniref:hypothetical protein n=1 Tax=Bacillus altitudinis TaxID=293387 RepID=UPI001C22F61A|nr:hypothetical protein [Bacillus altitudinis]MBU8855308.1 hypothetical protein [Bacillus sp. FJAT-26377]MCY7454258.1 hypothetical protein [Bacillus altitudinis]